MVSGAYLAVAALGGWHLVALGPLRERAMMRWRHGNNDKLRCGCGNNG